MELANGVTITPLSINTAGQTLVSVERMVLPARIGVADVAMTVGRLRGTPGELAGTYDRSGLVPEGCLPGSACP